ncbi:MAG: hypothetical protein A3D92_07615 [Bacteroidetes bacterium RIFCSPHIGHO2_02_FULL_44_7]|nr:MAG: hypothetical protein A3D92_07615 [Bacteroidetes bacterium RIFCSPHIGHO2_02_FULL_44_7]
MLLNTGGNLHNRCTMVPTLKAAGTIIRAFREYFAEEKREEKKIREQGIRKYIEEHQRPPVEIDQFNVNHA